ncbi:cytochrome c oxidase assembly protein [Pelomicrobium methylotrophicum]|uniref:Cytochrome c oxidase assembly protein CtaG n=1 Tax=Pelomicrobium methylotrophicum TaxID=2602750 RepID=A0A5C7EV14_9PROT|nr:cytochrome c oxidase assembly protein [Pelomicrobium methylotrophicum]TXF10863.1 cytochrome c oxidase assembly protein [Pelomicrobium methylotrophicum]
MSVAEANRALVRKLVVIAIAMFGFGFALVPLYEKFCEVTGIRDVGRADKVVNTQVDSSRTVTVELDTNVRGEVPWRFASVERQVRVHPGELVQVTFELTNPTSMPVAAQAIPSYGPQLAAPHVKKLECFCFSQQRLQPGETRRLPTVFVIDPALPKDVNTVTLSFTLFTIEGSAGQVSSVQDQRRG